MTDDRPVALCPACHAPLIATMHHPKHEFYCLDCGNHVTFFGPARGDPTPTLLERLVAYQAEWETNVAGKLITPHAWRLDSCDKCRVRGPYHLEHATAEERDADVQARAWIAGRVSK